LQHSASHYETPTNPISHSIRRSLNLENLSLLDKPFDEENSHYSTNQNINANKTNTPKHSGFSQDTNLNNAEQGHNSKLALLKPKHDVTRTSDDVTSPTSTVSSCRTNNGPLGQNTYNSADSSGYNTSSTLDVAEHPELLKSNLAINLSKYGRKQQTYILQAAKLNKPSHNKSPLTHIPDFVPHEKPSISNSKAELKTDFSPKQETDRSCKQLPVNVTSNRPDSEVPIPAPRALYPPSHTPSPTSNHGSETNSICQHRTPHSPQNCRNGTRQTTPLINQSPFKETIPASTSEAKNQPLFSSEGRCRNPINSFDILPTEKVILHEKILKEGTLY